MELKIRIEGGLLRSPSDVVKRLFDGVEADLRLAGQDVARAVAGYTPVNFGTLRQSITSDVARIGNKAVLEVGSAGSAALYATPVEFGTKAHFPPIEPLKLWVKRKLHLPENAAYAIALRIAGRIKGRPGGTSLQSLRETGKWGRWMFRRGFSDRQKAMVDLVESGINRRLRELQ